MMHLSRTAQPDLLLSQVKLRLAKAQLPPVHLDPPSAEVDAAIELLAGLVLVGVAWTCVLLLFVMGGRS